MQEKDPRKAYLSGLLWLPRSSPFDMQFLRQSLTFMPNKGSYGPKGEEKPIKCWADSATHIGVPWFTLGALTGPHFKEIMQAAKIPVVDQRPRTWERIDMRSLVTLDAQGTGDRQVKASQILQKTEAGILCVACGVGKTVVALHTAAAFRVPILVVVDNRGLQEQWAGEIRRHLATRSGKPLDVGFVGGGRQEWNKPIVVAIVNSLVLHRDKLPEKIRRRFGIVIYDECHLMGAPEFSKAAPLFVGRRWGLSATPRRADGLEAMYYKHLGPIVHTDLYQPLKPLFFFYRPLWKPDVESSLFKGAVYSNKQIDVNRLFSYLADQRQRLDEIVAIIQQGLKAGRKILVLSKRTYFLEQLHARIPKSGLLMGRVPGYERERLTRTCDVLVCQMKLGERALNKADLDMLIVAEPIKREEGFQQIVGRVQRALPGKPRPVVIFVEDAVGPCHAMCRRLRRHIVDWPPEKGGPYEWKYLDAERQQGGYDE